MTAVSIAGAVTAPRDKVYLVGFMAAGKTTVGRELAGRLGWVFLDIDERIEERERSSVARIFATRGEQYFRRAERDVLHEQVPIRQAIVATGGGTFVDPDNRALIQADGISVWLDAPLEALMARLPTDGRRPLAADRQQLTQLYEHRRRAYAQASVRVDGDRLTVPAIVEYLLPLLQDLLRP